MSNVVGAKIELPLERRFGNFVVPAACALAFQITTRPITNNTDPRVKTAVQKRFNENGGLDLRFVDSECPTAGLLELVSPQIASTEYDIMPRVSFIDLLGEVAR